MTCRPPPPVSQEILLIETGMEGSAEEPFPQFSMEPPVLAMVLMTLAELDGASLVVDAPILPQTSGEEESLGEILRQFDGEFALLGRNIRNLFDAIRVGSVIPEESDLFVEELINLTEQGKERLVSALTHRDERELEELSRAAEVFGEVRGFFYPGQGGAVPGGSSRFRLFEYREAPPDRDGKLRRIPVSPGITAPPGYFRRLFPITGPANGTPSEHIVYDILKDRYQGPEILYPWAGPVLQNKKPAGEQDLLIPLDKEGAVLFERPRGEEYFRHIPLAVFQEYEEADRALYRELKAAEALGIYEHLEPENHPPLVYEYVLSLKEELLQSPDSEKKTAWRDARRDYLKGVADFLTGPAEAELGEDSAKAFGDIRLGYVTLKERRDLLAEALPGSFCVLGPAFPPPEAPGAAVPGTAASALLANTFLTGRAITPGADPCILFWSLICAFFVCLCIGGMRGLLSLNAGLLLTLLTGAGFGYSFIVSGYWIDPLIPMAAAASGVLSSSCYAFIARRRYIRRLRNIYEPFVSRNCLRRIARAKQFSPSGYLSAKAAVVAVRCAGLTQREDQKEPLEAVPEILAFREAVIRLFTQAGAVIAGSDGDMVLAVFGSPPEQAAARAYLEPAARAAGFITELVRDPQSAALLGGSRRAKPQGLEIETASWHFGIDTGECAFVWTPHSGYRVVGRPAVRSRVLSSLAFRYRTRILISAGVNKKITHMLVRKMGALKIYNGDEQEFFYELVTPKARVPRNGQDPR
ncbi:MAG: hypothetical protein LBT95_05080 [Treponema sp.]|nr:hypothetical protein [Treponema sp.]